MENPQTHSPQTQSQITQSPCVQPPIDPSPHRNREDRTSIVFQVHGDGAGHERWYGVASSRLGRPVEKRRLWFYLLHRVVQQAVADQAAVMIVPGTTAADWLARAAEFYGCPTVTISTGENATGIADQLLVDLADRLFVLRCRRGGLISKLVIPKLSQFGLNTFVAIWPDRDDLGQTLVQYGAVGWWLYEASVEDQSPQSNRQSSPEQLCQDTRCSPSELTFPSELPEIEGGWLIHCTRGRSGPLPGQTEAQWRDEVLLGGAASRELSPLDTLIRILKQQRIRAVQQASNQVPVVCLAQLALHEMMRRRTFRQHRGRWDYEPFGLALSLRKLQSLGAQSVVYAPSLQASGLDADQSWRYQNAGKTFDWTTECEWRVPASIDLGQFTTSELVVFVEDSLSAYQITNFSRWPVIVHVMAKSVGVT